MHKSIYNIFLVLLAFLLTACTREDAGKQADSHRAPGVYYGESTATLTNLPPDAVLLKVNAYSFTHRDFDMEQTIYGKMMAFLKSGKMDESSSDIQKLQAVRAPVVLNTVLRRELLNQEARRRKIKASAAAMSARRKALDSVLAEKALSVDELAKRMGPECGKRFMENFVKDAENLELSWRIGGERLKVSEDEVTAGSNRLARINALTETTNSVLSARLQKALDRVNAGEDFAKVGSELSMFNQTEAKYWGTFSVSDFEDNDHPDIGAFLAKKPTPGVVGGPFQCDDGVSIVKVLSIVKGETETDKGETEAAEKDSDDAGDADEIRFKLARISVETFEMRKPLSRAKIRKILEDSKRKKLEAEFGGQLFAAAVIEFPSGTNLFSVAESADQTSKKAHKTYKGTGDDNVK